MFKSYTCIKQASVISSFLPFPHIYIDAGDYASLLQDQSGWIRPFDVDENGLYDHDLRCTWILLQKSDRSTLVIIDEIDIEPHETCAFDFLQVP